VTGSFISPSQRIIETLGTSMSWRMACTIIQREKQIHPSTNNYIHIADYVARLLPKKILKGPSELNAENLL